MYRIVKDSVLHTSYFYLIIAYFLTIVYNTLCISWLSVTDKNSNCDTNVQGHCKACTGTAKCM